MLRAADVRVERPQAADQHRHLGRGQLQHVRPLEQPVLERQRLARAERSCGTPSTRRLEHGERLDVGLLLRRVGAARGERDGDVVAGVPRRLLDRRAAAEHDQVGERDPLAARLRAVELLLDPLERLAAPCASSAGSLTSQSFCGARRSRAPFAPPRLSVPRNDAAADQAVATSREIDRPEARIFSLSAATSASSISSWSTAGHRVLPQLRLRHPRAEVARHRAHVAVQQLVPGLRERLGELVRVLVEALRDRPVDRVDLQREVGRQHHRRVPLRRVVRVGHRVLRLGVLRRPLLRAGGALGQLPLVLEEVLEEAVVPLRRLVGPGALEAARDRVARPLPLP